MDTNASNQVITVEDELTVTSIQKSPKSPKLRKSGKSKSRHSSKSKHRHSSKSSSDKKGKIDKKITVLIDTDSSQKSNKSSKPKLEKV